jgi:hypothetical protein
MLCCARSYKEKLEKEANILFSFQTIMLY